MKQKENVKEEVKEEAGEKQQKNNFAQGSIVVNILKLAVPMTLAQLINVLYNIVDRLYIGQLKDEATISLTGLGLCLPIISIVIAFANLFGMGGAPLCSIERGRGNNEEAEAIMGNSFAMMVVVGVILTVVGLVFKRPMLYLFGASDATIGYADSYITIYLMGNIFVMTGLGMNSFINSQGFGTIGMMTVLLGAVANIILDPVFIFFFHMGSAGNDLIPADLRHLDLKIPYRSKGYFKAEKELYETEKIQGPAYHWPWNERLYHVHYQQFCPGHV